MESAANKSRITLPDKPKVQAEEIDAALVAAREKGWCTVDGEMADNLTIGHELHHVTPMQMNDVLDAAFGFRHGLYNKGLRDEAEALVVVLENARVELDQIRAAKSRAHAGRNLARDVRKLLDLIADHPALKIAQLFHNIQTQLKENPDWNPHYYEEDDE